MLADRIKQWEEELIEQGIEKGSLVASRKMLTQSLQQKFGELPLDVVATIASYDKKKLDACLMQVLSATQLSDTI